jgi:pyruvate dehydrogenase E1 component
MFWKVSEVITSNRYALLLDFSLNCIYLFCDSKKLRLMSGNDSKQQRDQENREWMESLDYILSSQGPERVNELLRILQARAQRNGVEVHFSANTPYINTIQASEQPVYPGSREIERRIKSIIRWNAMAMVVRANR